MSATTVTDVAETGAGVAEGNGKSGAKPSTRGPHEMDPSAALSRAMEFEPLVRTSDLDEYREALACYKSGEWDDERWTSFRLRFGIYGQLQPGVQMVRIKIPGGILPLERARTIAEVNRKYCGAGPGHIHVTTRQDVQLYYAPLEQTPECLEDLNRAGLTTREACGNTLRNMNGCMLAGVCPREHVDAGVVAERLAHMWLRHPLVQHMPRKFKVSVSGCGTDCASSAIHDMGLVATERDGEKGFVVYGGGGTGGIPVVAVKLLDFATEEEVPAALEALVRLHQRYSNRVDRNKARIKFLLKRFGEEKFRALFLEEFERTRRLTQRPWEPLEWREPDEAPEPTSPGGVVYSHDGAVAVVVSPELGLLSSDQLEGLADIGERFGSKGFRTTRDQNLVLFGLPRGSEREVVAGVRALGLEVEETEGDVADVVSCPGTTTCRLGITNSQNFSREIIDQVRNYAPLPSVAVKISGCQNGCGLHHVGDFGFRGMGKKINGKNAPHYQIYVGGNPRQDGAIALAGPIVLARHAAEALNLLMEGYATGRVNSESVRDWALRLGKDGLRELVKPVLDKADAGAQEIFYDWGETDEYAPPEITRGECAASYALDNLLRDLADDGLIGLDRAILAGHREDGLSFGREGLYYGARRLLVRLGDEAEDVPHDDLILRVRAACAGDAEVMAALDGVIAARSAFAEGGDMDAYREALAVWLDTASEVVGRPIEAEAFDPAALGDSSGSVMEMLRSQGAV
jgi:sulfite reductase (NADPH) hemoprotein beta-component